MTNERIPARDLRVGDYIDAEPYLKKYAPGTLDYQASQYEHFLVEHVAQEGHGCTVIGMGSDHYGVPSYFEFLVVARDEHAPAR